jgi:hypothetical protein
MDSEMEAHHLSAMAPVLMFGIGGLG